MLIDAILERKINNINLVDFSKGYNPKKFYNYLSSFNHIYKDILDALDGGTEEDVKKVLCNYIIAEHYKIEICNYINRVNWL